jgi:TRAP-type C4-dicarboxylate transport system permease small subunit
MHPKLLQVLTLFALYVCLMIWFLHAICWWDWDQLKNTIIWTFSVALVAVFHSNKIPDEPDYFRNWITENFQIMAFIQFLVTLYTYPLPVELVVIPFVTLLTSMIAVGENKPETRSTAAILTNVLGVLALIFFGYALIMTVMDFWTYATIQTWRDLYVPIVLSILFLPFIFVLYVFMSYETTFSALPFSIKDARLRRSAKWRSFAAFGPNVALLKRWQRHVALHRPTDKSDLRAGIAEIKRAERRQYEKLPVATSSGWSPGLAKDFLSEAGLSTGDYHRSYDEEWFASSVMLEIGGDLIPNNIAYYIEGTEAVVTTLKLKLNVNDVPSAPAAEAQFVELARQLMIAAMGFAYPGLAVDALDIPQGSRSVKIVKDSWTGGIRSGYDKIFTIAVSQ